MESKSIFYNMSMIVLGMSGKMGVGKNYLSECYIIPMIIEHYRKEGITIIPYFFSFANFMKSELYARDTLDILNYRNMFVCKTQDTRKKLQQYGTEMGRNSVHDRIWIKHVELWIKIQAEQLMTVSNNCKDMQMVPLFVIQDIRFKNELEFVQGLSNAMVIRVEAPKRHLQRCLSENSQNQHISEKDLDDVIFPTTLYNDEDYPLDIKDQINIGITSLLIRLFF